MSANNRAKLVEIVVTLFDVDPASVTDDLSPERVEHWDSLNHLNICTAVGQEFDVELSTDEMVSIRNIGDIVKLLARKGVVCA